MITEWTRWLLACYKNTTNETSNGEDCVAVEIKGLNRRSWAKIFEVDRNVLHQEVANVYEPKIVAIGPIHRGKAHLKGMEQLKLRYLQQLVQRRADLTIEKLVQKVREMEKTALEFYSTNINVFADEFVRMLLLDGCFIIELVRRHMQVSEHKHVSAMTDPILEPKTLSQITHDLMLFENQLPFSVLNHLFNIIKKEHNENLFDLVLFLVNDTFPWSNVLKHHPAFDKNHHPDHLLGLIYHCITPFSTQTLSIAKDRNSLVLINSASKLEEAGIHLQGSQNNLLITFKAGVLEIPHLQVSGETESLLTNLMAYEQLCLDDDHPKYVTGYAFFMHCLIRSTEDIMILRRSGIINYLGGGDNICLMFDRLGTNSLMKSSDFCFSHVFDSLNRHCGRPHKKWMVELRRNYFNSPWSVIKFVGCALLLLIPLTQVILLILAFEHRNHVTRVRLVSLCFNS